jgi:hypothetical protein
VLCEAQGIWKQVTSTTGPSILLFVYFSSTMFFYRMEFTRGAVVSATVDVADVMCFQVWGILKQ